MILITGATGSNGAELVKLLSTRGVSVRAMARSRAGAEVIAELGGVELVIGNFDDSASVERALQGIEKAFLLTNSTERAQSQQIGFVNAARRTGLKHIVKLSQFAADMDSPVRFLRYHAAVAPISLCKVCSPFALRSNRPASFSRLPQMPRSAWWMFATMRQRRPRR
jgi:uncharacterized protein YbjT (DUF2867 family)